MADKTYALTFTLGDGSKKTVNFTAPQGPTGPAGKDGSNGKDGHTPVKGVDYFTDADIESIVSDVAALIGDGDGVMY